MEGLELLECPLVSFRSARGQHVGGKQLASVGSGSERDGLCPARNFTGNRRCGKGMLLDRKERLASHAIEHKDEALLAGLRYSLHWFAVAHHGHECWRGREVTVPYIV